MWKEVFASQADVDQMPTTHFADDAVSIPSRRASGASDDSFDASSYIHVTNKIDLQMPKSLLSDGQLAVGNHFSKARTTPAADCTERGKRVTRRRISVHEFNACKLRAQSNANNNSNAISKSAKSKGMSNSSSSDSDSLIKNKKRSTDGLSAKMQHLMLEMKRLRQLDRDVLRQFLIINDTIEEQRWLLEEKQEAIKRSLRDEGEDPVSVNFDLAPEVAHECLKDDGNSVQSMLSNSPREVFNKALPTAPLIKETKGLPAKDSDLVSTSSDSALSMSGVSSTLSSTTSLPVSNRSSSPPTSNLSTTSASSSYIDSMEKKTRAKGGTSIVGPELGCPSEQDYENDIEGYYRMYGAAMKRGSYPLPRHTRSFDSGYARTQHFDEIAIDSAYSTRRGSTDSDSRDAAEYAMAMRRSMESRSFNCPFRAGNDARSKPRPRSDATSEQAQDVRNRVQRISVHPDGTRDPIMGVSVPARRSCSMNDKTSAPYRLLHHSAHQRHVAKMNLSRRLTYLSFVPIVEQEPDTMLENGRLYSIDSDSDRRDYQKPVDLSKQTRNRNTSHQVAQNVFVPISEQGPVVIIDNGCQYSNKSEQRINQNFSNQRQKTSAAHQRHLVVRKPSSGRMTSSSSRAPTSKSSAQSLSKHIANEDDRRCPRPQKEPVWVQRHSRSVRPDERTSVPQEKAPHPHAHMYHRNQPVPGASQEKSHSKPSKRQTMPQITTAFRSKRASDNVLTVSCKPTHKGASEAVYNWIQTQDDVTYL